MAVGRDVMGADGLTNAERYAKRLADQKARQAAFRRSRMLRKQQRQSKRLLLFGKSWSASFQRKTV